MKVICNENGIKKAYVQKNDLAFLLNLDIPIPASIYKSLNDGSSNIIDDSNRFQFLEFTTEKDMQFLWDIDFIIDYRDYKDLSIKQMEEKYLLLRQEANDITLKFNAMTISEKGKNQHLCTEYNKLSFKIASLATVINNFRTEQHMGLPLVKDKLLLESFGNNKLYEIYQSLEPNVLILSRTDNQKIESMNDVSQSFYQAGLTIKMNRNRKETGYEGDYSVHVEKSHDSRGMYLTLERENIIVEEKGIKKLVKSLFKKD